jgi:hypothetical protein
VYDGSNRQDSTLGSASMKSSQRKRSSVNKDENGNT